VLALVGVIVLAVGIGAGCCSRAAGEVTRNRGVLEPVNSGTRVHAERRHR
jgi:hypothetical protein